MAKSRKRMSLKDTRFKTLKTWLRSAIRNLERAVVVDSWKGAGDPDSIPEIESALESARADLADVLVAIDDVVDRDLRARFPTTRPGE